MAANKEEENKWGEIYARLQKWKTVSNWIYCQTNLSVCSPFDLLSRLGNEESDGVGWHLGALRVDGDFGVAATLRRLHFYGQQ